MSGVFVAPTGPVGSAAMPPRSGSPQQRPSRRRALPPHAHPSSPVIHVGRREPGPDLTPDPESERGPRPTWTSSLACLSTSPPLRVPEVDCQAMRKQVGTGPGGGSRGCVGGRGWEGQREDRGAPAQDRFVARVGTEGSLLNGRETCRERAAASGGIARRRAGSLTRGKCVSAGGPGVLAYERRCQLLSSDLEDLGNRDL